MIQPFRKTYLYKITSVSGSVTTPVGVWEDVVGLPRFEVNINGGMSEMSVDLARKWSDFGETVDITNGNLVELRVVDRDTGDDDGKILASGYISGYTPVLSEDGDEHVRITVLGNSTRLNDAILTVSGIGVTQADFYSMDPTAILSTIIGQYNTTVSGAVTLTPTLDTTGTSVSYSFNLVTYKQAIDKVLELAPRFWWYSIDPDNTVQLHPRRYSSDHTLVIGRHVTQIEPFKNIEDIRNVVYFVGGGGLSRVYRNSSSIIQYGEKAIVLQDRRVTTTASADIIGNAYLASHANPEVRTILTVLDNNGDATNRGYDIDSFRVGQMVSILHPRLNFEQTNWDEFTWDDARWDGPIASVMSQPMQIVRLTYLGDKIILELSTRQPDVSKRLEDINRNLKQYITDTSL